MAVTTTYKSLLEMLLQRTGLGYVVPGKVTLTSTTSLTLADSYLEGPRTGASIPVGTPVKITSPADGGIATSITTTLLTDTTKAWVISEWIGFTLRVGNYKATITANTATTLTYAALDAAPGVGSPYTVELGDSFVSGYNAGTGVLTLNPALSTITLNVAQVRPQTIALLTEAQVGRFDYVRDAVNRVLDNRATRWQPTPLTYVPDGDLRGAVVTDWWTGTASTPAYVTPTFPSAPAHNFGNVQRVLQATTTNATNAMRSSIIDLVFNSTNTGWQWYFQTSIRVVSGTGDAQFQVWDETNNVQITTNVIVGSSSFTHTVTSLGFTNIEGTCNIPATCKAISFRLVSDSTSTVIQMTPLIAYPVDANTFPIPNRIISTDYIGNFVYAWPSQGVGGPHDLVFTEPITTGCLTHTLNNVGDHFAVTFNFRPTRPVWFYELTYDDEMIGLADVSSFPLEYLFKWARFELYDYLMNKQNPRYVQYASRVIPTPNEWLSRRNAALKSAMNSEFEPRTMQIFGRV